MRLALLALAALAASCAAPTPAGPSRTIMLAPADAATGIATGPLTMTITDPAPGATPEGSDPIITLELKHADGRSMQFQQANHTPYDLMAQAAGGPLAQVMGLFGEEAPVLYQAVPGATSGAPFLCAPEGPAYIGVHETADGAVAIAGLERGFEFETRPDGSTEAIPFAPDSICARLSLRRQ